MPAPAHAGPRTQGRPGQRPSRSPSGRCRRCTGLHRPLPLSSVRNAPRPKGKHHPFATGTREPSGDGGRESRGAGGEGALPRRERSHQDLSTVLLPPLRSFRKTQGCSLETCPLVTARTLPLPRAASPEQAGAQGAEPALRPALELPCVTGPAGLPCVPLRARAPQHPQVWGPCVAAMPGDKAAAVAPGAAECTQDGALQRPPPPGLCGRCWVGPAAASQRAEQGLSRARHSRSQPVPAGRSRA